MSVFDSLLNTFKSPPTSNTASPGSGQGNSLDSSGQNVGGGTIPNNRNTPNTGSNSGTPTPAPPPKNATDILDDIFKPDEPKVGADGKPVKAEGPKPLIELDNKTIFDNASKIDFSAAITDDEVTAARDDPKAFRAMLNKVGAMGSAISLKQNATMIEDAVERRLAAYKDEVKSTISDSSVESIIFSDSRFNSPSTKPMVSAIVRRIMEKDPTATPQKIKDALPQLMNAMAQRMQPEDTKKKETNTPTNFESFFD
jgi:hypothetical protein